MPHRWIIRTAPLPLLAVCGLLWWLSYVCPIDKRFDMIAISIGVEVEEGGITFSVPAGVAKDRFLRAFSKSFLGFRFLNAMLFFFFSVPFWFLTSFLAMTTLCLWLVTRPARPRFTRQTK